MRPILCDIDYRQSNILLDSVITYAEYRSRALYLMPTLKDSRSTQCSRHSINTYGTNSDLPQHLEFLLISYEQNTAEECMLQKFAIKVFNGTEKIIMATPTNADHPRRLYKDTNASVTFQMPAATELIFILRHEIGLLSFT